MTVLANAPDWSVALEFDHVARHAARMVAAKYRERAVASLAEYEDLHQEARILLATTFGASARELDEGRLRFRLTRDLIDKVKYRARDAKNTFSLDDPSFDHGLAPELQRGIDGQSPWGADW